MLSVTNKYVLLLIALFWFTSAQACYDESLSDKTNFDNCQAEAKQGHAYAQFNLGYMYRTGKGVPHSYKLAFKWYTKAAEQGDDYAQNNLGFMYDTGQGVIQDYELSHMWFNIAAANGNKVAIENRDGVAKKMTPAQIERAHDMASDWVANHSD
jgi:TPR repeat protein